MPGMQLSFRCPCGFKRKDVMAGASEDGHYYAVSICLQCQTILSVLSTDNQGHKKKVCRKCGKELMAVTERGAWTPSSLQNKFPDTEPWMVEGQFPEYPESDDDDIAQVQDIRILCPRCRKHSVQWECTALWD
jgi:DNA-directed RNA polymerase subunit M/transcription elongation factor TFIIS